jgi:L-asparaginase
MTQSSPLIALFMASGTLPSQANDRMETVRYAPWKSGRERMSGGELIAALPELSDLARIEVAAGNPYANATPADLVALAVAMRDALARPEVGGLVLIQGTNSLEETAYFLHLTLATRKPVVVTGAQRPFTALSTDGPANLIDAMRVATTPEAGGKGVLVVTNNEIHSARDVTKTSTYRVHTFRSRELGPLGFADADRIVFYRAPLRVHTAESLFRVTAATEIPRVDVLYVHTGANGNLARAAVDLGARGLVIAGSGAGAAAEMRDALAALQREHGTIVVRSSRVGEGRVLRDDNWQEPGMIAADNLNPHKSALLLGLALTVTQDPERIQEFFDAY